MKRILTAMLCIAMLALTTACDKSPAFEFRMDLSGSVTEATTNISANLAIHAENVADSLAFRNYECAQPLTIKAAANANCYLDDFVNQRILENLPNGALYEIDADGYITEKETGITFKIKKRWANLPDDTDELLAANSANTALITNTTLHICGVL